MSLHHFSTFHLKHPTGYVHIRNIQVLVDLVTPHSPDISYKPQVILTYAATTCFSNLNIPVSNLPCAGLSNTIIWRALYSRPGAMRTSSGVMHTALKRLNAVNQCWSLVDATDAVQTLYRRCARDVILPSLL